MWRRQSGWSRVDLHPVFTQCIGTVLDGSFIVKRWAGVGAGRVGGGDGGRDVEEPEEFNGEED